MAERHLALVPRFKRGNVVWWRGVWEIDKVDGETLHVSRMTHENKRVEQVVPMGAVEYVPL